MFRLRSARESLTPFCLLKAYPRRLSYFHSVWSSMSIPTVSYEAFSTSNQALVTDGGPWIVQSDPQGATGCTDNATSWCEGYCLVCAVYPLNAPRAYYGSFATNISVNLTEYGGITSLDFSWNFWPLYCGSNTTTGASVPITSQVGDDTFKESFPAVNYTAFYSNPDGHQWDIADKISHNGSTSVVRGSDPNLGYIAIKVNVTMAFSAENHQEHLDFYIKGIRFLITTPTLSATAASSSSTSTQQAAGSSTITQAGVIAAAVIGGLAFVVLFILAVCLFRGRDRKGEKNPVDNTTIFTEPTNHEALPPLEEGAIPPPH